MNEETQRSIFHYLKRKKIENFLGVPDSTLKHFIDECQKNNSIIITTREDEAIGIANEAVKKKSKVLWLQYGIHNDDAEKIAKDQNMDFVSNKCIKQEYQRLFQKSNPVFPVLRS